MTKEEALKIIGRQPMWAIHNMILALEMSPWLDTSDEDKRLQAAKVLAGLQGKN